MKTKDAIAICEDLLDWLNTLQRDSSDIDALTVVLKSHEALTRRIAELEFALNRAAEFASQYDDGDNAATKVLKVIDDVFFGR